MEGDRRVLNGVNQILKWVSVVSYDGGTMEDRRRNKGDPYRFRHYGKSKWNGTTSVEVLLWVKERALGLEPEPESEPESEPEP